MANRVFQNVVYKMKDAVDRVVGVIDETGTVISCSELGQIGEEIGRASCRKECRSRWSPYH